MKNLKYLGYAILIALLGLWLTFDRLPVGPATATTQDEVVEFVFFADNTRLTADTCSAAVNARITRLVDTHIVITSNLYSTAKLTDVNTTTLRLYHSNVLNAVAANWVVGEPITSAVITHARNMATNNNKGVFTKLCADLDATSLVPITVSARALFYPEVD